MEDLLKKMKEFNLDEIIYCINELKELYDKKQTEKKLDTLDKFKIFLLKNNLKLDDIDFLLKFDNYRNLINNK